MNQQPQQREFLSDSQIDALFSRSDSMKLSEWETKFVASVKEFWTKNRRMSDKQRKRLAEIRRKNAARPV